MISSYGCCWVDEVRMQFAGGSSTEQEGAAQKLFAHYDKLPEEMRLALPLKRVWMVASQELD